MTANSISPEEMDQNLDRHQLDRHPGRRAAPAALSAKTTPSTSAPRRFARRRLDRLPWVGSKKPPSKTISKIRQLKSRSAPASPASCNNKHCPPLRAGDLDILRAGKTRQERRHPGPSRQRTSQWRPLPPSQIDRRQYDRRRRRASVHLRARWAPAAPEAAKTARRRNTATSLSRK